MTRERKSRGAWWIAAALAASLALPATAKKTPSPPPEEGIFLGDGVTPNLYQMMGRSEAVVRARLVDIALYARFTALEVYVGKLPAPEFEIIYRGMSWERRVNGLDGIRWSKGDEYVLFLNYYREREEPVRPDLFELRSADWGARRLGGESDALYVEALRLLIGAAARPTHEQRNAVLVGLIGSSNHLAAGAAMVQVADAGLGDVETIPTVLRQMDRGIVALKYGGLRLLRKLVPTLPPSMDRASVAEAIHARIAWTAEDPVEIRLRAVEVLAALGEAALPFLEAASTADPDQKVRYEAAVHVYELKS